MNVRQLIDGLGGYRLVAERLGVKPSAVHNWIQRESIPADFWSALVEMAKGATDDLARDLTLVTLAEMRRAKAAAPSEAA